MIAMGMGNAGDNGNHGTDGSSANPLNTSNSGNNGYRHYMGGCQNMVPFWIPIIIRHLILIRVPKKGTIILTTTHMLLHAHLCFQLAADLAGIGFSLLCIK